MFPQQLDDLSRDPQIAHWMSLLTRFLLASAVLILIVDIVLFLRWIVYQVRARAMFAPAFSDADVPVALPAAASALEETTAQVAALPPEVALTPPATPEPPRPQQAGGAVEAPPAAEAMPPPQFVRRRPFAPQWSLAHPFVGGQIVVLVTNLVVILIMIVVALPVALRSMGNPGAILRDPGVERALLNTTIFSLYLQNALFVLVVAVCVRWYGRTLAGIGLRRPTGRQIALGVGLGLAVFLAASALEVGLGRLLETLFGPALVNRVGKFGEAISASGLIEQARSPGARLGMLLGAAVAAPIGEEVFFRGLLYNALKYRYGLTVGMVVSGLAFALIHISPLSVVLIFPMGVLLAYVYERTQSLWVAILMHAVNNGIGVLLLWKTAHG